MKFNFVNEMINCQKRTKSYTENYSDVYSNAPIALYNAAY